MSFNTFGHMFRVTTWGESHGPALGCVIDGCPPGVVIDPQIVQRKMDRRKPGQSRFTTQRREDDAVEFLSGVLDVGDQPGMLITTGTPISIIIHNKDQRSKDYSQIRDQYRPGHADMTYDLKYGIRDYRGGGAVFGKRNGGTRRRRRRGIVRHARCDGSSCVGSDWRQACQQGKLGLVDY